MPDLAADDVGRLAHASGVVGGHAQQFGGGADRCERVAQFVRQHREELVLATVCLSQRVEHVAALGDVEHRSDHSRGRRFEASLFVHHAPVR